MENVLRPGRQDLGVDGHAAEHDHYRCRRGRIHLRHFALTSMLRSSNNQFGSVEPGCIASVSKGEIKARTLTAEG